MLTAIRKLPELGIRAAISDKSSGMTYTYKPWPHIRSTSHGMNLLQIVRKDFHERALEREMVTRFSQPTSLITWLSARTPTIMEHEWIHGPTGSEFVSYAQETNTIKDETETLHVYLYCISINSFSLSC